MQQENTIPQPPPPQPVIQPDHPVTEPELTPPQPTPPPETPPQPQDAPGKKKNPILSFLNNFGILIAAPLIALLLINFVFQSYEVDGPSMQETLQNGDRLVVVKANKSLAELRGHDYIPDRYSIIIFHKQDAGAFSEGDRQLVKRVIGIPGDRVVLRDGAYTIYNDEHPNGYNPDVGTEYEKDIPAQTSGNVDITVPAGEVFVSGDNRSNSLDSRAFGTIKSSEIVGELRLRIFPFSEFKAF